MDAYLPGARNARSVYDACFWSRFQRRRLRKSPCANPEKPGGLFDLPGERVSALRSSSARALTATAVIEADADLRLGDGRGGRRIVRRDA
jgi:hypothetical protein